MNKINLFTCHNFFSVRRYFHIFFDNYFEFDIAFGYEGSNIDYVWKKWWYMKKYRVFTDCDGIMIQSRCYNVKRIKIECLSVGSCSKCIGGKELSFLDDIILLYI